jgi:rhodanese-related sulfurtransferase
MRGVDAPLDPPEVDVDTFSAAVDGGAAVLDVRNPDEYEEVHVPGAVLIPLGDLLDRLDEVPRADPVYVICAAGGRSLTAVGALSAAGYRAVSVAGGTNAWVASGRPVVSGPDPGRPSGRAADPR